VPETLKRAEKRTERCNQHLAHSVKGSKRHALLVQKLERAYMHEANIKKDWREKLTTKLIAENSAIVIDDFGFEGAKNLDINRALYRVGCYAFKQRLEEKAAEAGASVAYVPRGIPTSRTCSGCGHQQVLKLEDRTYVCPHCGLVLDRDINAAINVYNYC
jgi:putative transposase